jgi:hypothetical protein
VVLCGCGPKNKEVAAQEAPAAAAMREKLGMTAAAIAAAGDPQPCTDGAKPSYAPNTDQLDADWIMFSNLEQAGKPGLIDFSFSDGYLPMYLTWTDPKNDYFIGAGDMGDKKPTPMILETFKRVKGIKHVLVVRPLKLDREAGTLDIDVWRATLDPPKAVCGYRVTASADPKLSVEDYDVVRKNLRTGEQTVVRSGSTDKFASALWTDARTKVFADAPAKLGAAAPKP